MMSSLTIWADELRKMPISCRVDSSPSPYGISSVSPLSGSRNIANIANISSHESLSLSSLDSRYIFEAGMSHFSSFSSFRSCICSAIVGQISRRVSRSSISSLVSREYSERRRKKSVTNHKKLKKYTFSIRLKLLIKERVNRLWIKKNPTRKRIGIFYYLSWPLWILFYPWLQWDL